MEDEKQLGDVADLFGLDEFGAGGMLGIAAGAVGAGVGAAGAVMARKYGKPGTFVGDHPEVVGLLAGVAAGGAMAAMPSTRSAGWTAIAAALAGQGVRVAADAMAKSTATAGWGGRVINPTHAWAGLGLVDIQPTTAWAGAGDGMPQLLGGSSGLGRGGAGSMPQLVGASLGAASQHVQLLGGPALSDVAGNWGSTHFNKR